MTTIIDPVAVHADIEARLRQDGQMYTRARRTIIHTLLAAGRALTIPELLDLAPGLTQSSTYRNLTILEAVGIVVRHHGPGPAVKADRAARIVHYQLAKA